MQLAQYLKLHQITRERFAELVGASEYGVRKWVRRERTPRPKAMRKIQEVTEGEVTPADFFVIQAPEKSENAIGAPA